MIVLKRKFVVDYRENGVYKHHIFEVEQIGDTSDDEMVYTLHMMVGINNVLDGVIEVYTDKSISELENICLHGGCENLDMRPLYMNEEEFKKTRAMMGLPL